MPLFHVHGLVASTLATLASGETVVVPPKFNPLSFWRTVRDTRATWGTASKTVVLDDMDVNLELSIASDR